MKRTPFLRVAAVAMILVMLLGSGLAFAEGSADAEKMPISIAVLTGYTNPDSWMEQQLEEKYNVDITLVPIPGWTDGQAKINLMMADDSQRPDVIWWWGMDKEYMQWVEAGLLHDLTPYMEKYRNIVEYYTDQTMYYASHVDGKMYRVPGDVAEPSCMTGWIRQDWLGALGLSVPTTREEFANVLEQFATGDPDGNGADDTYGFSGVGMEMRSFQPFWSPYGVDPGNFVVLEDGSVIHGSTEPAVKDALADIAELYKKGVIDPVMATKMNNPDEVFVNGGHGAFYRWVTWINPGDNNVIAFHKNNPGAELVPIEAIQGADGTATDEPENPGAWCYFGITKNAKDPERIYAMFDDMLNRETYIMRRWGVEGTHYELVDGAVMPLVTGDDNVAQNIGLNLFDAFVNRKDDANIANTPAAIELFSKRTDTSAPARAKRIYFKSLERPEWYAMGTDIEKVRDEVFYGIITGQRPVDDFDHYLEQYKAMNGEAVNAEATQLYQQQKAEFDEFVKGWSK